MAGTDLTIEERDPSETILEFPENRHLQTVTGEFDRHLSQIEETLEIQIARRGNQLILLGTGEGRERGAEVLTHLYERAETNRDVGLEEVKAALRFNAESVPVDRPAQAQMEMFSGGAVEIRTRKKVVEPRTDAQRAYVRSLFSNELAFGIGPAGTGKTYIAVAVAVNLFINNEVDRIILCRPAVEAGERLGFLPGTQDEKVDPYMQPLYDALNDFLPGKQVNKLREEKKIEIAPLAFMRGRTLSNAAVILDEAQNATAMQMKMFLTRLGEGSRMVITGDRSQVDLPRGVVSGLTEAERLLKDIDGIAFNYFTATDVVRHPLVAKIIQAYDKDAPLG